MTKYLPITHLICGSVPNAIQCIDNFSPSTTAELSGINLKYTLAKMRKEKRICIKKFA